jgi:polysaccharide biosynthesis/export protein
MAALVSGDAPLKDEVVCGMDYVGLPRAEFPRSTSDEFLSSMEERMCKHSRQFAETAHRKRMVAGFWLAGVACFGLVSASAQNGTSASVQNGTSASVQNGSNATDSGLKYSQYELIRQFEETSQGEYTISAGDEIDVQVPTHTELQGHHVVGPDGKITLPIVGSISVTGQTREGAAEAITTAFEQYYTEVRVAIQVTKYGSNRVIVVGRVASPGPIFFDSAPTLLEALAKGGAYSPRASGIANPGAAPTINRCAIYRGSEEVLWVDLKKLFASGTSAIDITLRRGDVVYVPDEQESQVSVLGQVRRPGAVTLGSEMRLVDVLALAGGLTEDAAGGKIRVLRPSTGLTREVAFADLVKSHGSKDIADISLENGDVIYVPQTGFAKVGYVLQKLSPMGSLLMFGALAAGR